MFFSLVECVIYLAVQRIFLNAIPTVQVNDFVFKTRQNDVGILSPYNVLTMYIIHFRGDLTDLISYNVSAKTATLVQGLTSHTPSHRTSTLSWAWTCRHVLLTTVKRTVNAGTWARSLTRSVDIKKVISGSLQPLGSQNLRGLGLCMQKPRTWGCGSQSLRQV